MIRTTSWLLVAMWTATSAAQLSRTSEKIEVNVIEVDAVVLDAHGNPVPGLSPGDFELRVGGRTRTITNFYEVNRRMESDSSAATAPQPVARRDYLVLFIDDLHLNPHERKRALDALRSFIRQHVRPGSAAMLVQSNGDVRILEKFTEDPSGLLEAIDRIASQPPHADELEMERREILQAIDNARKTLEDERTAAGQDRTNRTPHNPDYGTVARQQIDSFARHQRAATEATIDSLDRVVHAVEGLDGRRVLVYVSDGLPMQPGAEVFRAFKADELLAAQLDSKRTDSAPNTAELGVARILAQMQPGDAMSTNLSSTYLQLARRAALAGVQFFAIDASGVQGFHEAPNTTATSSRLDSGLIRSNLRGPIQLLADETGGQAILDTNDIDSAFSKLDEHLSSYYSVGFVSEGTGSEDDINVRVKTRGLTVRAAKHVRQRTMHEQIADRVRASLYARVPDNPLDAAIDVQPLTGAKTGVKISVRFPSEKLSISPGDQSSFSVFVAMLDENMRETPTRMFVHRVSSTDIEGAVHVLTLDVPPGKYTVSMAVADTYSAQASYLQQDVTIPAR